MRRVYPGSYVFVQLASAETSATVGYSEYNECGMLIELKYKGQSACATFKMLCPCDILAKYKLDWA
jgi:hypothetical protein